MKVIAIMQNRIWLKKKDPEPPKEDRVCAAWCGFFVISRLIPCFYAIKEPRNIFNAVSAGDMEGALRALNANVV